MVIDFPKSGPAVFIGWNGSGKTSVLEALGTSFSAYLGIGGAPITKTDVKLGTDKAKVRLSGESQDYTIKFEADSKGFINSPGSDSPKEYRQVLSRMLENKGQKANLPILMYYSTNRFIPKTPSVKYDEDSSKIPHPSEAWRDNMQAVQDFRGFFRWFRLKEDVENEKRLRENPRFRDRGLTAVRESIGKSFSGFENPYIRRTPVQEFVLRKRSTEEVLSITQLSDGERGVIIVIADIARRLEIANPSLENPLYGRGIVLIDEIELHLHPAWQRKIITALEATFPNIQFILTTHSPQVISEVARSNIFLLENFKVVTEVPHTLGRDSNTLLQDIFNVPERPKEVKAEFKKLYRILDHPEKKEEGKQLLEEMSQKYGADDPEIQRATLHYEFMNEA